MKTCIDPGHGGADPGAVGTTPRLLFEKTFTLDLALLLAAELTRRGHEVTLTRTRDQTLGLGRRARIANQAAADIFVSLHANAAEAPTASGMEVFHFPESSRGERLATSILDRMHQAFQDHRNRGVNSTLSH